MRDRLNRWIENLPEDANSITFRAGESRREEDIIQKWVVSDMELDDLIDVVEDTMTVEHTGRVIAYNSKSKQIRSMNVRGQPKPKETSDVGLLVEGLIRMSEEQRRFLATMSDSFQTMHDTIQDCIFQERQHHEDVADAQLAIAINEHENTRDQVSTTDRALGLLAQVVQQKAGNVDIKSIVMDNPEIIDELLQDETIVSMVLDKAMKSEN